MYDLEKGELAPKDVMDVTRPNQKYSAPEFPGCFLPPEDLSPLLSDDVRSRFLERTQNKLSARLVDEMSRPPDAYFSSEV